MARALACRNNSRVTNALSQGDSPFPRKRRPLHSVTPTGPAVTSCSTPRVALACARLGRGVLAGALLALAGVVVAQTCALPGYQGAATPTGVINSYHGGSGSPAAGATTINVASATGLRTNNRALVAGDLILVMQMQDSATPANAGGHEYAQIASITGTAITLTRPLARSYFQTMNTTNVRGWQVVWVPQYSSASITGSVTADGYSIDTTTGVVSGGVMAADVAGSLAVSGTIDVSGRGFRGGFGLNGTSARAGGAYTDLNYANANPNNVATLNGALKGEGIVGTPPMVFNAVNTPGTPAAPANYLTLLGQGYAGGGLGRGAQGNAGGAGNDGDPPGDTNGLNSGGGGGGGHAAGGQGGNSWNQNMPANATYNNPTTTAGSGLGGNPAGGQGGNAIANSAIRLTLGGGGGAGTANNAGSTPNLIVSVPPTVSSVAANGAQGAIASSGANGGGVVMVRAGTISGAGTISADGYRSYNKAPVGNTDSAGGGGGGGSVFLLSGNGAASGLVINARGGDGGSSNYYNHGPGGGGGGGLILTNFATGATSVIAGIPGTDACCGGTTGNASPKNYNAQPGTAGQVLTTGGTPAGLNSGAQCLPSIAATKTALSPTITAATGATTVYSINLTNSGGGASNVYLLDASLPPGWLYTSAVASTYTYSPAPPGAGSTGAETTAATIPATFPVNTYSAANSNAAVSLRAAGAAPGVVPATGANTLTFGSFYLPQNGSLTVSFVVTIPDTATVGTYHNPGGVLYLDPTRDATLRAVSPATNVSANRTGTAYSANTTYFSGSTTGVAGANYSGLAGGPTTDDVRLLPDFSITKSAPATVTAGSTFTYTITPRNNGRAIGTQAFASTQATDAAASALGSSPLTITDTLPTGVSTSAAFSGAGYVCTGTSTVVCTRADATAYPVAAATDFPVITATMTMTAVCTPAPTARTNGVAVSTAAGETITGNNTATAVTSVGCYSADIRITKTDGVGTVNSGSTTSYTVTVANLGAGNVPAGTVVSDTASAGLSCSTVTCSSTPSTGICQASSYTFGDLTSGVTLNAFPANNTVTFVVSCSVTASGS